ADLAAPAVDVREQAAAVAAEHRDVALDAVARAEVRVAELLRRELGPGRGEVEGEPARARAGLRGSGVARRGGRGRRLRRAGHAHAEALARLGVEAHAVVLDDLARGDLVRRAAAAARRERGDDERAERRRGDDAPASGGFRPHVLLPGTGWGEPRPG